ncbi:hypothetical protein ALC57_02614 [Trachymyrmex cornetzi]|uniref:Uncharacterized protein n=1 Tax=Trachymyrmex cornetzi TaxID=471704 RepID=A0A151JP26_9HYME|nr:hypothetical protein ALC57_02614 [Trachymyrmex cornetzi]
MYYERRRHYNPILIVRAAAGSRGGYCVACNMGDRKDRRIDDRRVDGYYESESANEMQRYVFQFHGCFWHGYPTCYQMNRDRVLSPADHNDTIDARYKRTLALTYRLQKRDYHVIEKWECDFDWEMRENPEMSDFLKNHSLIKPDPLEPRDAFFGDRTGNITTRYEITSTKKIMSFVSDGSKFYAYIYIYIYISIVRTPEGHTHEVCKIKGILNFNNSIILNFNSIK